MSSKFNKELEAHREERTEKIASLAICLYPNTSACIICHTKHCRYVISSCVLLFNDNALFVGLA